ncbi:hypothetical protein PMIN06_002959 [Paraphaeosphaeria minitans]
MIRHKRQLLLLQRPLGQNISHLHADPIFLSEPTATSSHGTCLYSLFLPHFFQSRLWSPHRTPRSSSSTPPNSRYASFESVFLRLRPVSRAIGTTVSSGSACSNLGVEIMQMTGEAFPLNRTQIVGHGIEMEVAKPHKYLGYPEKKDSIARQRKEHRAGTR